jgi:hypothetical protein
MEWFRMFSERDSSYLSAQENFAEYPVLEKAVQNGE